jgi:Histidine kinase
VAERQRSGMAAELHDGPIQGLTRLGLSLERGQLRLRRGQLEEGRRLLTDAQAALSGEVQSLRRIMATLRDRVPSLPVIILSAYEDPALKSEADAANVYLVKGCSGGLVLDTIEQAWASRSGRASPN